MKEFLKLTKIKIGLAIGILAFYFIEGILYCRNVAYNFMSTGEMEKVDIELKIMHYVSGTIFIPLNTTKDILGKLGMYFFNKDVNLINYFSAISVILLLLLIFYCYFLSCLVFYLKKKKRK